MHVELLKTKRRPCFFNREAIDLAACVETCRWIFGIKNGTLCHSQRWMPQRDVDYALKFGIIFIFRFIAGTVHHDYEIFSGHLCFFYFFPGSVYANVLIKMLPLAFKIFTRQIS